MNIKVLIADDAKELRSMIARALAADDFEVVGEASNGPEAVLMAAAVNPDVVILDYVMPGMTGEQAAQELRERVPGIKIVACSGSVQSKPYWADTFIEKGRLEDLQATLRSLMESA